MTTMMCFFNPYRVGFVSNENGKENKLKPPDPFGSPDNLGSAMKRFNTNAADPFNPGMVRKIAEWVLGNISNPIFSVGVFTLV